MSGQDDDRRPVTPGDLRCSPPARYQRAATAVEIVVEQRDRARTVAVALEQELAAAQADADRLAAALSLYLAETAAYPSTGRTSAWPATPPSRPSSPTGPGFDVRTGSLCPSFGGLDLGLQRAGVSFAWHVEVDSHASAVLAHLPTVPEGHAGPTDPRLTPSPSKSTTSPP